MKKKVALYIRVSTHHQIDKDSLPFQRKELINYAKYALNIDDYEVFEDAGYSGKDTDRPKYQEMMNRIRQGEFTHMLVWKIDRISRNLIDFTKMYEELKDYGVTFVSKNEQFDTSSAMGEAMLKIILIFAELERKLTAERVYAIMLSRAEKGLWNGAPVPLGYDYNEETKFPTVNEEEAKIVRFMYDEYLRTHSTGEVKHSLEKMGYRTKRNRDWGTKVIGDMLKNPFYIGTYRYNYRYSPHGKIRPKSDWIVVEDNHEPIVEKEIFEEVQKLFRNKAGLRSNNRRNHIHVFSGLLTCPNCNLKYSASTDSAREDGYKPSRYRCYTFVHNKKEYSPCRNTVGEVVLGPFFFRYMFNLIRAISTIKKNGKMTTKKLEKILLSGSELDSVAGIVTDDLDDTIDIVLNNYKNVSKKDDNENEFKKINDDFKMQENKVLRALERLDELYLFSDDVMTEKEYLVKKQSLDQKLNNVRNEFKSLIAEKNIDGFGDLDFIEKATKILILENVLNDKSNYNDIIKVVDKNIIKAYVNTVVENIIIDDKKVLSIEFTSGMIHRFVYK